MKVLIINGPNLNMLGLRETLLYGEETYASLCEYLNEYAAEIGVDMEIYQSNHEGEIVEKFQRAKSKFDAIIINVARRKYAENYEKLYKEIFEEKTKKIETPAVRKEEQSIKKSVQACRRPKFSSKKNKDKDPEKKENQQRKKRKVCR